MDSNAEAMQAKIDEIIELEAVASRLKDGTYDKSDIDSARAAINHLIALRRVIEGITNDE